MSGHRHPAMLLAGGLIGLTLLSPRAGAAPSMEAIDCSATRSDGALLIVDCVNPDSTPGVVDILYACSTPLDFDHRMLFDEPGNPIGAGATFHAVRDCGPDQVVVLRQVVGYTQRQLDDQSVRQRQIREKRDREAGR